MSNNIRERIKRGIKMKTNNSLIVFTIGLIVGSIITLAITTIFWLNYNMRFCN